MDNQIERNQKNPKATFRIFLCADFEKFRHKLTNLLLLKMKIALDLPEYPELKNLDIKGYLIAKLYEDGLLSVGQSSEVLGWSKEQFLENCVHYINGGKFSVNRELITFCQTLRHNHQDDAIVIDDNETPIKIDDLQTFLDEILNIYFTSSYEYLDKYNEIKSNRSVEGLIDL